MINTNKDNYNRAELARLKEVYFSALGNSISSYQTESDALIDAENELIHFVSDLFSDEPVILARIRKAQSENRKQLIELLLRLSIT